MGLSENQQLIEQVQKSNSVLLVCEKNSSVDGLSSALAFSHLLQKMGKKVELICDEFGQTKNLEFLPGIKEVKKSLDGVQQTILIVDANQNKITDFSYDVQDDKLYIYLTPQKGTLTDKQVKVGSSGYKYDLIITFDVDDYESIGPAFENNTEFFYDTPLINIAQNPENEQFGQINKVELAKTSVSEVLYDLFVENDEDAIDEKIATCLLTGIISKTKGFKTQQVTPKTLHIASDLMERGADRELIVQKLYQTKSIDTLRLWGTTLSRLTKEGKDLAWSYLTAEDFKDTNSSPETLREIIEELIVNAPEAQIISLFYVDRDDKHKAILYSGNKYDSLVLAKPFSPFGNKVFAEFVVEGDDLHKAAEAAVKTISEGIK